MMFVEMQDIDIQEYERYIHLEFDIHPEIAVDASDWCKATCKNKWTCWLWSQHATIFWFTDPREAMLFKLKFVGV